MPLIQKVFVYLQTAAVLSIQFSGSGINLHCICICICVYNIITIMQEFPTRAICLHTSTVTWLQSNSDTVYMRTADTVLSVYSILPFMRAGSGPRYMYGK